MKTSVSDPSPHSIWILVPDLHLKFGSEVSNFYKNLWIFRNYFEDKDMKGSHCTIKRVTNNITKTFLQKDLNPDPHWISSLDPDPERYFWLDPDPHETDTDPKLHWWRLTETNHILLLDLGFGQKAVFFLLLSTSKLLYSNHISKRQREFGPNIFKWWSGRTWVRLSLGLFFSRRNPVGQMKSCWRDTDIVCTKASSTLA